MSEEDFYCCCIASFLMGIIVLFCSLQITRLTHDDGMIKVASGEYKCEMIEQQDKTTEWECERVEK